MWGCSTETDIGVNETWWHMMLLSWTVGFNQDVVPLAAPIADLFLGAIQGAGVDL